MIELYLGTTLGGWAHDGKVTGWASHAEVLDALSHWTDEIVQGHSTRWRKPSVTLWLSGGLARPFLCGPIEGLTKWSEAEAVACAMAPDATGLDGGCQVSLEAWPRGAPALATAVNASLTARIAELSRTRRIVWRSVRPRWAAALDEALQQRPALRLMAFDEPDAVTVLGGAAASGATRSEAAFDYAVTYSPAPEAAEAVSMWNRTVLSRDVTAEEAYFERLETSDPPGTPTDVQTGEASPAMAGRARSWPTAVHAGEGQQR